MSRLHDLMHAEVLSWDVDGLEYQTSERQGPVEVWNRGVLIKSYPFYAHWVMHGPTGDLWIRDPIREAWIGHHLKGAWQEVGHMLHLPPLFQRAG